MYQVNVGKDILYYPGNDEYAIYDTELVQTVGLAGEFTFKVPPTNPLWGQFTNGAIVTILKDGKEYWRGDVQSIKTDFGKVNEVYCLEDLSWLNDEAVAVQSNSDMTYNYWHNAILMNYNRNQPATERMLYPGYITNVDGSADCNWTTEYGWSIMDAFRACICKDNGYLRIRRLTEYDMRAVDIVRLEDYGKASSQPVEYGYNLLDFVKNTDLSNLVNVITPYGAELEDTQAYEGYSKRLEGNVVSNQLSINTYGRRAKAVIFDDADTPAKLNAAATEYLNKYSQPQLTMEVNAVDLAPIENTDSFEIGDQIRVISKPFSIDQVLYLTEIKRDIQHPDKNTITLSGAVESAKSLTSQMHVTQEKVEEIPSKGSILDLARKNALNLLLDETQGGYVVYEYDSNSENIEAINVCNKKTIEASTKRWRWSQNGLGYMERANITDAWPTAANIKIALTSDGQIVANRITSGEMTANVIKAGVLKDKNGTFSLNMESGSLVMNNGTFKGKLEAATGTFSGSLKAATGTFNGKLESNGTGGSKVTINNGSIKTNSVITTSGVSATNVIANTVSGLRFESNGAVGKTGQITWSDSNHSYSLNIRNGLIVGIGQT